MVLLTTQENVIEDVNLRKWQNSKLEMKRIQSERAGSQLRRKHDASCCASWDGVMVAEEKGESSCLSPYHEYIMISDQAYGWILANFVFVFMNLDFVLVQKRRKYKTWPI